MLLVLLLLSRCTDSQDCQPQLQAFGENSPEYQQCLRNARRGGYIGGGGSFGGYSSGGGGHK
jgi:uncharacterized membrane protein YgcG